MRRVVHNAHMLLLQIPFALETGDTQEAAVCAHS